MCFNSKQSNPLVAFVGMPGSGKSAVVRHLAKKGWRVVHFGAITMDEIKKRGLAVNEENELNQGRTEEDAGMEAYARLSITRIKDSLSVWSNDN